MNKHNKYTLTIILLLTIVLSNQQIQTINNNYVLIAKDKVSKLYFNNLIQQNTQFKNLIWISNNQASFTIQVPVLTKQNNSTKQTIQNYTNHFAQIYEKILNKGYLKPYKQQNFVKGYKYFKKQQQIQSKNQQQMKIFLEFLEFLKNILQSNGLSELYLQTNDIFNIQLILTQKQSLKVNKIKIAYQFPKIQIKSLHKQIKKFIKETYKQSQYLQQNEQRVLQRTLTGRGLHQKVNITISLSDKQNIQLDEQKQSCIFQFLDILPQSTYIDSDQRRKQTANYQIINIQLPEFVSKQYFYKYSVPLKQLKQSGINKYAYQQPIHFRYPKPSKLNITKVQLHDIVSARIICKDENNNSKVYEFKQKLSHPRGVAMIPTGEENLARVVNIISLVVCLIALIKIINTLKKD